MGFFPYEIVLASGSPQRKKILRSAGIKFKIYPSHIKETIKKNLTPAEIVKDLAYRKANFVAAKFPERFVLGADTMVFIKGKLIGKPVNEADARKILNQLSAAWQKVYTGVAVICRNGNVQKIGVAVSSVKLKKLQEKDILRSIKKHMDKAGAYAVQEKGDPYVEQIRGDYDNVVGLPMRLVKKLLFAGLRDGRRALRSRLRR